MAQNTFATVLMTADLDHLADQVLDVFGVHNLFRGVARQFVLKPLEIILKFVPPDIVEVLISAVDGLTTEDAARLADTITEEAVEYSKMFPDVIERPVFHAIVTALLSYAMSDKPLTLHRGDA